MERFFKRRDSTKPTKQLDVLLNVRSGLLNEDSTAYMGSYVINQEDVEGWFWHSNWPLNCTFSQL